jgi:hypothetical protein
MSLHPATSLINNFPVILSNIMELMGDDDRKLFIEEIKKTIGLYPSKTEEINNNVQNKSHENKKTDASQSVIDRLKIPSGEMPELQ